MHARPSRVVAVVLSCAMLLLVSPTPTRPQPVVLEKPTLDWKPLDIASIARRQSTRGGSPTSLRLWDSVVVPRSEFFARTKGGFRLGAADVMVEVAVQNQRGGRVTGRFRQTHGGIPVEHAFFTLDELHGAVTSGAGRLAPGLALSTVPSITPEAALAAALAAVSATRYRWQVDPIGSPQQPATLVIHSPDFGETIPFELAYRLVIATVLPEWDSFVVYVSAKSGLVIEKRSAAIDLDFPTTGVTAAGANVSITTQQVPSTQPGQPPHYRLAESTQRLIGTWDRPAFRPFVDFVDDDNEWDEPENRRGVSAHWAAEQVWDYLIDAVWLMGPDGKGTASGARGIVTTQWAAGSCDRGSSGTHYDHNDQTIYLCLSRKTNALELDVEVVGHEVGHSMSHFAMVDYFASLEGRALGESLADVVGTSVKAFVTRRGNDWTLGSPGSVVRDMENPKSRQHPDTFEGEFWAQASAKGDYHAMAGVGDHWFYLLATGGQGVNDHGDEYDVRGQGRDVAEEIVLHTLLERLTPLAIYSDYRAQTEAVAIDYFGEGSDPHQAVRAAWDAVGVEDPNEAPDIDEFRNPPHGGVGVLAWPTKLEFSAPEEELEWKIQLSTDSTFSNLVVELKPTYMKAAGGPFGSPRMIHGAERTLRPRTVYYWRVKARSRAGWSPWGSTTSFQTSGMAPRNVEPAYAESEVHPWATVFSWDVVPGATAYEVRVHREADKVIDAGFLGTSAVGGQVDSTVPVKLSFPRGLAIDRMYFWSVRAKGPYGETGSWSTRFHAKGAKAALPEEVERRWDSTDALTFSTSIPEVDQDLPGNGDVSYPWPVTFTWKSVQGAVSYEWELAPTDTTDFAQARKQRLTAPKVSTTINVKPELAKNYYWRLRAWGPVGDPVAEPGAWSQRSFVMDRKSCPTSIQPQGASLTSNSVVLSWSEVPGALGYAGRIMEFNEPDPLHGWGIDTSGRTATSFPINGAFVPEQPYKFSIHAKGPEGLDGFDGWGSFAVRPPPAAPCDTRVVAGTIYPDERTFELGKKSGTLILDYSTYDIHDRIEVFLGDSPTPFMSTGCDAAEDETRSKAFNSASTRARVRVSPNCNKATAGATKWDYTLRCP